MGKILCVSFSIMILCVMFGVIIECYCLFIWGKIIMRLKKFKYFYIDYECFMYFEDIIFFLVSLYFKEKNLNEFWIISKIKLIY